MDDLTSEEDEIHEPDPYLVGFAVHLEQVAASKGYERGQSLYRSLGKQFGIGPKGVEKWFLAKSWPRNHTMIALSEWAGVTIDWLMSGREPKQPSALFSSEPIKHVATIMTTMDPAQQYLAARLVDQIAQPPSNGNPPRHDGNRTHGA